MELRTKFRHYRTHGILCFLCNGASPVPFSNTASHPGSAFHWATRSRGCTTLATQFPFATLRPTNHARPFVVSMMLVRQLRSPALIGVLVCLAICFASYRYAQVPSACVGLAARLPPTRSTQMNALLLHAYAHGTRARTQMHARTHARNPTRSLRAPAA